MTKEDIIKNAEAMGWKRHIEKGDPDCEEWWGPDGKFYLYADLPVFQTHNPSTHKRPII